MCVCGEGEWEGVRGQEEMTRCERSETGERNEENKVSTVQGTMYTPPPLS